MATILYGAYGTGNLGDDLLLKGALLEHDCQDIKVVAYGKPFIEGFDDYIDHFDFINHPESFINKGDILAFAGGGLFWAATHCDDMLKVAKYAKSFGCQVFIKRIGAQGFHCNPDAVKELMSLCDSITVRDQNSVEILKSHDITEEASYLPDYVLTLSKCIDEKRKIPFSGKVKIGINHSATPFYHDISHRKKALHIYSFISEKFKSEVEFYYLPHTRHFKCIDQNDVIYGEHFWNASNGLIKPLDFPETIDDLLGYYSMMDGVVGWRYHLLVLGTLFDCEVAHLGSLGGHKYGAFARENNIPQIDFDLSTNQIIQSFSRWIIRNIESCKK